MVIQLGVEGYTICILDTSKKQFLGIKQKSFSGITNQRSLALEFKECFNDESTFSQSYQEIYLLYSSSRSSLVPDEYFSSDLLNRYFSFAHHSEMLDFLYANRIKDLETFCIFPLPNSLSDFLRQSFPNLKIYHQSVALVNLAMQLANGIDASDTVLFHIQSTFFYVIVTKEQKLVLCNSFGFKNHDDLLYFSMLVIHQLKLAPNKVMAFISGIITQKSLYIQNLQRFLPNIRFVTFKNHYTFSSTFDHIPEHHFSSLIQFGVQI